MKIPPKHPKEIERLAALERLNILDTQPEDDYDQMTLIASQICETPIALVSLVDGSRQWFKSKKGIDINETPREIAFCAHAILEDGAMVVPDARLDERFKNNPLVTGDPAITFYAGAQVMSPEGLPIGTLCVVDFKPRQLRPDQISALNALARQIGRLLQLRTELAKEKLYLSSLEKKEAHLTRVLDGVPAMIGHWDSNLKNLHANKAYTDYFGKLPSEIRGMSLKDLTGPDLFEAIRPHVEKVLAGQYQSFEREIILPSGKMRNTMVSLLPEFENGKVVGYFAITTDITKMKELEHERETMIAHMIQSSKLSTLGEMAGGVAHEINTPLAVIISKLEIVMDMMGDDKFDRILAIAELQKVSTTAERIAKIVKGLRQFSRHSEHDPKEKLFIKSIVDSTLELCHEKLVMAGIELRLEIDDGLAVDGRPAELSQVIMNLISNAIDAVEVLSQKHIVVSATSDEKNVVISVTDSGSGIDSALVEKIMNPFFTTKEVGRGTGLGLSISKGIIEAHGGRFYYDTQHANTRFVIELPALAGSVRSAS